MPVGHGEIRQFHIGLTGREPEFSEKNVVHRVIAAALSAVERDVVLREGSRRSLQFKGEIPFRVRRRGSGRNQTGFTENLTGDLRIFACFPVNHQTCVRLKQRAVRKNLL